MKSRVRARTRAIASWLVGVLLACAPSSVRAQRTVDVPGSVVDVSTGRGIADVVLRVEGTDVSAASDDQGHFVLRGVPEGVWTLRADHVAYGSHSHQIEVNAEKVVQLQIRLAVQAMELDPIIVETQTARERAERGQGSSLNVVERPAIERALGTSKHMGDLLAQTIPGIRLRQTNNLAGTDVCLEFRGAASISLAKRSGCSHPLVLLDGVPVSNPNLLYGSVPLSTIERIQVVPPGDAGARYGTGALYGVILIETQRPGGSRAVADEPMTPLSFERGRKTFDWSTDPGGYPLGHALLGATLGHGLGLLAGVAIGRQCLGIDDKHQITTACGGGLGVAAGLAAMALPALGGALGVRLGGGTATSVGRLVPAALGAAMMLFPGYAFSMSTVGGGSATANAVGHVLLVAGPPLVLTFVDRLFRRVR